MPRLYPSGHAQANQDDRAAVALTYDRIGAPRITASGEGDLATRIVDLALASGVPTFNEPGLAAVLTQLDVGSEIPVPLYHAVAELIAFAWLVRGDLEGTAQPEAGSPD